MMQRKHPGEAMTGEPGALPGEAIRILTLIVAPQLRPMCRNARLNQTTILSGVIAPPRSDRITEPSPGDRFR